MVEAMFVERKVRYSALFTNLVGWHAGAVSWVRVKQRTYFPLVSDMEMAIFGKLS